MINPNSQSLTLSSDVKSYILEDEVLLFSKIQKRLYRLNEVAALIWCCFEERMNHKAIVDFLIKTYGITQTQAQNDLQGIIQTWHDAGFLESNPIQVVSKKQIAEEAEDLFEYQITKHNHSTNYITRHYHLIDTYFQFNYSSKEIEEIIHPLLKHLESHPGDTQQIENLYVLLDKKKYLLLQGNELVDYCDEKSGLAPMIHANILKLAYGHADFLLAIHAGAVYKDGNCMVLPAISGSGKSTLTAALLKEGYGYCTDDMVLLSRDEHLIRPVPVSLGVKEGAWPVLSSIFPDINELPIYKRADNKFIRYLSPPIETLPVNTEQSFSVTNVIFPKYESESSIKLTPLSSAEALCRITEAGYDLSADLNVSLVSELIQWVSEINCYSLEYGKLSDAITEIKKLF